MDNVQWWLAELDQYGNAELLDGPHDEEEGAHTAYYLYRQLGMDKDRRLAIARVELQPVRTSVRPAGVNEEALELLRNVM